MFSRRCRTRPMPEEIVGVRPIGDGGDAPLRRNRHEARPQLRLTEVATILRVGRVTRIIELLGLNLEYRQPNTRGNFACGDPLTVRIRGAAPDDRQHTFGSKHRKRDGSEIRRVDPSAVADGDSPAFREPATKPFFFRNSGWSFLCRNGGWSFLCHGGNVMRTTNRTSQPPTKDHRSSSAGG